MLSNLLWSAIYVILQIDSLLSSRLANENDASRRLKSEFLVQFDGVASNPNDLVIVIGEKVVLFSQFLWLQLRHSLSFFSLIM